MGGEDVQIGVAEARSALAWWLDAGVDALVQEEPRDWLKAAEPRPQAKAVEPPPNIVQPAHDTLADLQDWLSSSMQLPLASATARRLLPHGPEEAAIMLLSDAHTFEDLGRRPADRRRRLGTDQAHAGGDQYPCRAGVQRLTLLLHLPGSKMSPADREACAEIARRHIKLARPKRLLLLGDGPLRPCFETAAPGARACSQSRGGPEPSRPSTRGR